MAVTPYGATPGYNPYNPYSTPANPYAPNPMQFSQPMNYTAPTMPTAPVAPTTPVNAPVSVSNNQTNNNSPFIPVSGINVVKDAQVPANQTGWFMNQNVQEFYVKSADNLGVCQTKYYRFTEFDPEQEAQMAAQAQIVAQQQVMKNPNYITRDEVEELISSKIEAYKNFIMPTQKQAVGKPKKEKEDAE